MTADGGPTDGTVTECAELVRKRADLLAALEDGPLELRTLEARMDASRSTVNRAIRELEGAGLVRCVDGEHALTVLGRLGIDHYRAHRRGWRDLLDAADALAPLESGASVDSAAVVGGNVVTADERAPYRTGQRLRATLDAADGYRAALPAVDDPAHFRLVYEHVVTHGRRVELIVPEKLRASLADEFPRRLAAMRDSDGFSLRVGEVGPFGLVLADGDGATTLSLLVFDDDGRLQGLVENGRSPAVEWGEREYDRVRAAARPAPEQVRRPPDGGTVPDRPGASTGTPAPGLVPDATTALDREGFVRLTPSFFVDREVADPVTAWRAGPDLTEVHTGYAAERTRGDGDDDEEPLTDHLFERLAGGRGCVLVGPPGSGKSTTCKRVACAWYAADRGPVLYRERGRGAAFESVEKLLAAVGAAESHALVVVEDAVRAEASAVFDAIDRIGDRPDVDASFLLDARESEWRDPPDDVSVGPEGADLDVETMPRLSGRDVERIVDHFERTAGVDVEVPVEGPSGERRAVAGRNDAGDVLLLAHRLALYADPLATDRTTLDEDVRRVYEEVADGGDGARALDVAVLAAVLTAAGVGFGPAHLHAVADPGEHDAVAAAIDRLEGRMLFGPTDEGTFRTVHEVWAGEFLATLLDAEGAADARRRFRRCVSRFLAVADDPDARERAERAAAGSGGLERAARDPSGWADETVERLFGVGLERPKLVDLFGDHDGPVVGPAAACTSVTEADCVLWYGQMCLGRGAYDRAETAYDSLPSDGEFGVERLLGLATVAERRGDYTTARERAEACVAAAREAGDRQGEAAGLHRVATAHLKRSEFERAEECFEESIDVAREAGDREVESWALNGLGAVAQRRGEYDRARERYEQSLEIREAVGDRRGEALLLNNLGLLATNRGEFDRARSYLRRSLERKRELGDRASEASTLNNLGMVARERNRYDRAREYFETALEINRETGAPKKQASNLGNLGDVARRQGEYDRAEEYHEAALAIEREHGIREKQADDHNSLGAIALERDEYERAREHHEEALAVSREVGYERGAAHARLGLGRLARRRGDYESAREEAERARTAFADAGGQGETKALRLLGLIAADCGDEGTARERLAAAAERFADAGAVVDALETLEQLVDLEVDAGNPGTAREGCERALAVIDGADRRLDAEREAFEERRRRLTAGEGTDPE